MLFAREGHARDLGPEIARQRQRHAAPAAADIEHAHSRTDQKFTRDMAFLGLLRLFQRHVGAGEIGAGILPVRIKEEIVEIARQVIVMRYVGPCARRRVELIPPPLEPAHRLERATKRRLSLCCDIGHGEAQEAVNVIALDGEGAIHIPLSHPQIGRQHDTARQARIAHRHGNLGAIAGAIAASHPVGICHMKPPVAEKMAQQPVKRPGPHRTPPIPRHPRRIHRRPARVSRS